MNLRTRSSGAGQVAAISPIRGLDDLRRTPRAGEGADHVLDVGIPIKSASINHDARADPPPLPVDGMGQRIAVMSAVTCREPPRARRPFRRF